MAVRSPWHPSGAVSPLHGLHDQGLSAALRARGHQVRSTDVPPSSPTGVQAFRDAAEHGRRQAEACSAGDLAPDVWLCDGYLSALAGSVAAAGSGGRLVVWLGAARLPSAEHLYRLSAAVIRSASAVLAASGGVAQWLLRERLTGRAEVVHPPVDPGIRSRARQWRSRLEQQADEPPGATTLAVLAPPAATELSARILRLLIRADPGGRVSTVASPDQRPDSDIVVAGLGHDGGLGTMQAMARGLAVISLPSLPDQDLIEDRVSGLRAPDGHALVTAVRELKRDPFLREALAQGAIDRVDSTLSTARVAVALEHRLGDVLGSPVPVADRIPHGR